MAAMFGRSLGPAVVLALLAPALASIAGCGITLKEQSGEADGLVDAPLPDAPIDATPVQVCSNGRVVYLHFTGNLELRDTGAGQTDATQNRAEWLAVDDADIPAYKAQDANRLTEIQEITAAIRLTLGAFPITVVTERPAAGPYHMVVFGGNSSELGNNNNVGALTGYDCQNQIKNNVVWVGERFPPQTTADFVVGAIGLGLGLSGTLEPGDCMCGWGNICQPSAGMCTLSSSILNDGGCNGGTRQQQNEIAAFRREFCEPIPASP
jgi:hypothetical protein